MHLHEPWTRNLYPEGEYHLRCCIIALTQLVASELSELGPRKVWFLDTSVVSTP